MNKISLIFAILFFYFLNYVSFAADGIQNYQTFFGITNNGTSKLISIRKFTDSSKEYLLAVNPDTLETSIIKYDGSKFENHSLNEIRKILSASIYAKALFEAEKNSGVLQNAGLSHFSRTANGIVLTADLCPSRLGLEKTLFREIIENPNCDIKPVPVALAVTGLWMEKHKSDLEWIKDLEQRKLINITWINHSYTHRYDKKLPLQKNFLLTKGTDIDFEVLETEKEMLANGLLPSVFFRFPGLVSDRPLFMKITGFGLIPLGSDAWIAKDQAPLDGSIVLVHANGNEPKGVSGFINIMHNKKKNNIQKSLCIYDLKKCMVNKFK